MQALQPEYRDDNWSREKLLRVWNNFCLKEKHTKVSNEMPVCNSFQKAFWIDKTIQKWQSEISELELSLNGL